MGLAALAATTLVCVAPRPASAQTTATPAPAPPAAPAAAAATPASAPDSPFTHGKAADGATKAAVCAACHGPNGNSTNPDWPRLAGQSAVYIAGQLRLFRSGARPNPVMMPMATSLSDQDIADLAVYYEAQTPVGLEADPSYWQAGQGLYLRGGPRPARVHRVPRARGPRQPGRRLPRAARAAVGLRGEAAE